MLNKRKEWLSGKRLVLNEQFIVTTEELQAKLAEAERNMKQKKTKKSRKKVGSHAEIQETGQEDTEEEMNEMSQKLQDWIEVNRG